LEGLEIENVSIFYGNLEHGTYVRLFGIFYGHLLILWEFSISFSVLVHCIKKNLATLEITAIHFFAQRFTFHPFLHSGGLHSKSCLKLILLGSVLLVLRYFEDFQIANRQKVKIQKCFSYPNQTSHMLAVP
jgi:hypothetical protein